MASFCGEERVIKSLLNGEPVGWLSVKQLGQQVATDTTEFNSTQLDRLRIVHAVLLEQLACTLVFENQSRHWEWKFKRKHDVDHAPE